MVNDKQYYEITDAFLALKDIDDEDVAGMIQNDRRVTEGKSFSIQTGSKDLDAARKFLAEESDDDEIEVIDVDADTAEHLKKNTEYIGQGILCCNRCKANRFIDMDLLLASDADEDVYNVEDECPHCHDIGAGYTLIGQVGKVQKEKPETVETEEGSGTEEEGEIANLDNDEKDQDEATFDNDVEEEPGTDETDDATDTTGEGTEEETTTEGEGEPEVDTLEDDSEDDGMETDTSEDELDDLDLPTLGDEIDQDETEEDEDNVRESLTEKVHLNALAEEAWMMNEVISAMNNEDAYYGAWLYIWPDGESREECAYDFGDQESFDELEKLFLKRYKYYHADGLFNARPEVVEYAHKIDSKLGLAKIENIMPTKPAVRESYECSVAGDVFKAIMNPEKIDKIVVFDISDGADVEPRTVFKGTREDIPLNVIGSPCKSFDVADGYLSCNIDTEIKNTNRPLNKALECFSDDRTDKVLIWDQATGDEVFSGTKNDACNKFGDCEFISFETPAVVRICINNPSILSCDEIEDEKDATDMDKLIKKIIDANNLSQYKTDKPNTNEYWIKNSLELDEDVELIYESFVKPLENKALTRDFKRVTGYNNPIEEAYEAGFAAARNAQAVRSRKIRTSEAEDVSLDQVKAEVNAANTAAKKSEDDTQNKTNTTTAAVEKEKENIQESDWSDKYFRWTKSTQAKLDKIVAAGLFDKLKDDVLESEDDNSPLNAITRFYNEDGWAVTKEADGGPDAEERKKISKALYDLIDEYYKKAQEKDASADKKESFKSFKTRKELAEAVTECKNNSKPYTIRRSIKEGFRYDLITEEIADDITDIEVTDNRSLPVQYSTRELEVMNNIHRVAEDIATSIKRHYNIDVDTGLVVADILQDLKLISGEITPDELPDTFVNNVTKEMFKSYQEFYNFVDAMLSGLTGETIHTTPRQKIAHAVQMLQGPEFSTENIDKTIGSTRFLDAARNGAVPYITANDVPMIEEAFEGSDCEERSCENEEDTIDVDVDAFDAEMNQYFDEAYEDTVLYTTTDGHIQDDGTIVLEGLIQLDENIKHMQFTLTPEKKLTESVKDKKAALVETLKQTYIVTNNASEEKFEFKFEK